MQLKGLFGLEYVTKVPLPKSQSEWNVRTEKRQGEIALKKQGSIFGFEEVMAATAKLPANSLASPQLFELISANLEGKTRTAIALEDCLVVEGPCSLLLDYLSRPEILELAAEADAIEGHKMGKEYLGQRMAKKNRLKQFLDAA